jgi:GAF domain
VVLSDEAARVVAELAKAIPAVREERKVFALVLVAIARLFGADGGAIYIYKRGTGQLHKVKALARAVAKPGLASSAAPDGASSRPWDVGTIARFFRNEKPVLDASVVMAPVRVAKEVVGVLALERDDGLAPGAGKSATEIVKIVGGILAGRKRVAELEAEASVAQAITAGVDAKDVAYRVLHQLRRFIDYDHGATLIQRTADAAGRVIARQVAWSKGRSSIVGSSVDIPWADLPREPVIVARPQMTAELWDWLPALREAGAPEKGSGLVALIASRRGCLGLIELAASREDFFRESDIGIVEEYVPHLAWCLGAWVAQQ